MTAHVNSYYAATLSGAGAFPPLAGKAHADVCVVGGGLAGLTAALELVRRGRSVIVLEARRVGWGASGRNGGIVTAGFAQGLEELVRRVGLDHARGLFELSREGLEMVRGAIAEFGIDAAQARPGCLQVVRHDDERRFAEAPGYLARTIGREVEYWPTEKVRAHLKSDIYHQALFDPHAFRIHPLNYAAGLAAACAREGVRLHEGSQVTGLGSDGARRILTTATGSVEARDVVLAHSAYGNGLNGALDRAVLPIATYVVTTRACPVLLDGAIATENAVADTRRACDYYRRLADGRLLWGGRITTRRSEPSGLAASLKRDISAIYPQLGEIEIEHAWSGLMAYATHKMPIVGRLDEGLWVATCFGGHGLNTTAIAGRLIAGAIAGDCDRYRLFQPFGTNWAGGVFGRGATQVVYWYYQMRDRLEEARARRGQRR